MFTELSLPVLALLFLAGAVVILWSGTRIERVTDAIASSTGMGRALAGLLLLALATSLPEVATTATAVLRGNVELAVANLLGGAAVQVLVLTVADAAVRRPLTATAPSFAVLMQGVGVMAMLGVAVCGLTLGHDAQLVAAVGGVSIGLHPVFLLLPVMYVVVVRLTQVARGSPRWQPVPGTNAGRSGSPARQSQRRRAGGRRLWFAFVALAALVTLGGWATASSADALAERTGVSSGFIGVTLLAVATSLPEISTTVAAAREGNLDLAISNIMGSNGFDISLLALVAFLAGDALRISSVATIMAGLGVALTAVYLLGVLERSDRSIGRLGLDSVTVVLLYLSTIGVVFLIG